MVDSECRKAGIGCVECKKMMAGNLVDHLAPFQEKRAYYLSHGEKVMEILNKGTGQARSIARQTMEEVREAIKL
jgi:tryptophanyl-tRNA synthetase